MSIVYRHTSHACTAGRQTSNLELILDVYGTSLHEPMNTYAGILNNIFAEACPCTSHPE